ncbi:hypothetical protein JCM8795_09520 [Hydrogenobaculum acidophilum]
MDNLATTKHANVNMLTKLLTQILAFPKEVLFYVKHLLALYLIGGTYEKNRGYYKAF